MASLGRQRFVFITGKGGVGKTTVAAAQALALARRGYRVLITVSDAKERLSTLLGVAPLESAIRPVADGIWAVRITSDVALQEYGRMVLRSRALYEAVFNNKYVRSFFGGVPGLSEWAVLGKAWYHSTEQDKQGRPRFDVVLFDAPATGHGLDMLRVPKVIVDVAPPGVLRRDAERAWTMFRDPEQSAVVVVSQPEDMPTTETLELTASLRDELGLPLTQLVVNGVLPELFTESERTQLLQPRELDRAARPGDEAIAVGIRRAVRERVQGESLARLGSINAPEVIHLPMLVDDAATPEGIGQLSGYF